MPQVDKNQSKEYERNHSHYHCWQQEGENKPACGIPIGKHNQCCLCDILYVEIDKNKQNEAKKFLTDCGRGIGQTKDTDSWVDGYISIPRKPVKWFLYGLVVGLLLAYMIIYG